MIRQHNLTFLGLLFLLCLGNHELIAQPTLMDQLIDGYRKEMSLEILIDSLYKTEEEIDWQTFIDETGKVIRNNSESADFLLQTSHYISSKDVSASSLLVDKSIALYAQLGDSTNLAKAFSVKSYTLYYLGKHEEALVILFKAMDLIDKTKNTYLYAMLLGDLSRTYELIDDFENSLKYANMSMSYYKEIDDTEGIMTALCDLGRLYIGKPDYDSAIYYFRQVISETDTENSKIISSAYGNLAQCVGMQGDYLEAIKYQQKGLNMELATNEELQMIDSYLVMGGCHSGLQNTDSAKYYFALAKHLAEKHEVLEKIADVYEAQAFSYPLMEDYQSAYHAQINYQTIRDSIQNKELRKVQVEMNEKYESSQKEALNVALTRENQNKDESIARQQYYVIGAFLLFMVAASIAWYVYRLNLKTKKLNKKITEQSVQLTQLNKTKDRLFSIIGHDLRGPITSFESVTAIIKSYLNNNDIQKIDQLMVHIDKSAKNVNRLLNNLLNWSITQEGNININIQKWKLGDIVNEVLDTYQEAGVIKGIVIESTVKEEMVWADRDTLGTIIRNLLSNALKFSPEQSKILLESSVEGAYVHFKVIDQGRGISEDVMEKLFDIDKTKVRKGTYNEQGTGLGLVLVKEFITMNDGFVRANSELGKGTVFTIGLKNCSVVFPRIV